jgi:hypothetical protein
MTTTTDTSTGMAVDVVDDNANIRIFKWLGTLDDLVHFVYGNQGGLFGEGTCLYRMADDSLSIMHEWYVRDYEDARRVYGTWEHTPAHKQFASESEYEDYLASRGDLADAPEYMGCYACGGYDGHTTVERAVVGFWHVVNRADPTQSYVLACGHVALG